VVPGTSTSAKVTGLSPESTYYYRVTPIIDGSVNGDSNVPTVATSVKRNFFPALFLLFSDEGEESPREI
jgi:hypothetical protein